MSSLNCSEFPHVPERSCARIRSSESRFTGYLDYKLNKRLKLEAYYLKGLTVQSPDRGAGVSLALDF